MLCLVFGYGTEKRRKVMYIISSRSSMVETAGCGFAKEDLNNRKTIVKEE